MARLIENNTPDIKRQLLHEIHSRTVEKSGSIGKAGTAIRKQ